MPQKSEKKIVPNLIAWRSQTVLHELNLKRFPNPTATLVCLFSLRSQ